MDAGNVGMYGNCHGNRCMGSLLPMVTSLSLLDSEAGCKQLLMLTHLLFPFPKEGKERRRGKPMVKG